jgi:hypothetical protein
MITSSVMLAENSMVWRPRGQWRTISVSSSLKPSSSMLRAAYPPSCQSPAALTSHVARRDRRRHAHLARYHKDRHYTCIHGAPYTNRRTPVPLGLA